MPDDDHKKLNYRVLRKEFLTVYLFANDTLVSKKKVIEVTNLSPLSRKDEKSFEKRNLKTVYLFTNVKFINSEIFRKQKEELLNYLKTHFLDFD